MLDPRSLVEKMNTKRVIHCQLSVLSSFLVLAAGLKGAIGRVIGELQHSLLQKEFQRILMSTGILIGRFGFWSPLNLDFFSMTGGGQTVRKLR